MRIDEEILKCPTCGEEWEFGTQYCSTCGTSLYEVQRKIEEEWKNKKYG